jgi:hypothetical protein
MRSLGFGTKVLSVFCFAVALAMTLRLPWYGPAPKPAGGEKGIGELHGPLDGMFKAVTRWVSEYDDGTSAWRAFATVDLVLVGFAALAAVSALLASMPATEHVARALLRAAVAVVLGLTVVKLFDTPGDNALMEPRYGIFAATAAAIMLATSGFGLATQRLRATARSKPHAYVAPTAPEWQEHVGRSAPPPRL